MRRLKAIFCGGILLSLSAMPVLAEESVAEIHLLKKDGAIGDAIGKVHAEALATGVVFKVELAGALIPGPHGMHIHENGSCDAAMKDGVTVPGLAAGGHYDPAGTGKHLGPSGEGHLGDLPILYAPTDEDGAQAFKQNLVAPRLKLDDVKGRALVIHERGDNFRDEPNPLGGGGARVACGVFSK